MFGTLLQIILDLLVIIGECLQRHCKLAGMKNLAPVGFLSFAAIWWTLDLGLSISSLLTSCPTDGMMIVLDTLILLTSIPQYIACKHFLTANSSAPNSSQPPRGRP